MRPRKRKKPRRVWNGTHLRYWVAPWDSGGYDAGSWCHGDAVTITHVQTARCGWYFGLSFANGYEPNEYPVCYYSRCRPRDTRPLTGWWPLDEWERLEKKYATVRLARALAGVK